jgi:hypothetical protein
MTAVPRALFGLVWLTATAAMLAACSQNPPTVVNIGASPSPSAATSAIPSPTPTIASAYPTAKAAAIAAAKTKTGYGYSDTTPVGTGQPTLVGIILFGSTDPAAGLDAAAAEFGVDGDGTVTCFAYVYFDAAGWHPLPPVVCREQASAPWPEKVVSVVAGTSCANVRRAPGLSSKVAACLKNGTPVTIDNIAPRYVDGHIWWSVNNQQGWMAHDLLITP